MFETWAERHSGGSEFGESRMHARTHELLNQRGELAARRDALPPEQREALPARIAEVVAQIAALACADKRPVPATVAR